MIIFYFYTSTSWQHSSTSYSTFWNCWDLFTHVTIIVIWLTTLQTFLYISIIVSEPNNDLLCQCQCFYNSCVVILQFLQLCKWFCSPVFYCFFYKLTQICNCRTRVDMSAAMVYVGVAMVDVAITRIFSSDFIYFNIITYLLSLLSFTIIFTLLLLFYLWEHYTYYKNKCQVRGS